jgi:hypothetical protein
LDKPVKLIDWISERVLNRKDAGNILGKFQGLVEDIKKWLSYREERLLGRVLRLEEVEYVTGMIRRIAAILLLGDKLNANYTAVKADAWVV